MIYLAFYRAAKGNWLDWGIALRTFSHYSHVEISFANPVNPDEQLKRALCFSASPRDRGTRFKTIDLTDGKWEVIKIPWIDRNRAREFCESQNGLKYDFIGVLSFLFPFLKPRRDHWFCSEVASALIEDQDYQLPKPPKKMSPEDLLEFAVQYKHNRK